MVYIIKRVLAHCGNDHVHSIRFLLLFLDKCQKIKVLIENISIRKRLNYQFLNLGNFLERAS